MQTAHGKSRDYGRYELKTTELVQSQISREIER